MKKMFLFFSHILTETQIQEAKTRYDIDTFVYLPENIQKQWSQIEPYGESIYMTDFYDFLTKNAAKDDFVLIKGDYGAVYNLVNYAFSLELNPVYSTTVRGKSINTSDDDKLSLDAYKHCRFRRFK